MRAEVTGSRIPRRCLWLAVICLAAAVVCSTPQRVMAGGGFLDYLFALMFADEVPAPPALTPEDLQAIDKMEAVLVAQNRRKETSGNYLLLGVFAAAKQQEAKAAEYLDAAAELEPDSPLLATVSGQVAAQVGDYKLAKEHHEKALETAKADAEKLSILAANAHLDLAAVYANLGDPEKAKQQLSEAKEVLGRELPKGEAALTWLQMGVVYATALRDPNSAQGAWESGSQLLGANSLEPEQATLKVDLDLRIADTYIAQDEAERAAQYVDSASAALETVPAKIRPQAQFAIGDAYVQLASKQPEVKAYAQRAEEQLAPLIEPSPDKGPGDLTVQRDAAVAYAKLLKTSDPEKSQELGVKAFKETLEIGQSASAYQSVFSARPIRELPDGVSFKKELKLRPKRRVIPRHIEPGGPP